MGIAPHCDGSRHDTLERRGPAMCEVCGDPMHKLDEDDGERSTIRGSIDNAHPVPAIDDDNPQP
jgi:hypothetical protein